jgi:carbon-monoxide dehydrogenase medium subunit
MISGYIRTQNVLEAVQALDKNLPWGRIIAGGTDILSKTMATRHKQDKPLVYIDIKRINELREIRIEGDCLVIGPVTTLHQLIDNTLVQTGFPVLAQAGVEVGSAEIRNRATVGGNIGSKSANADLLVPLIGLGAKVEIGDLEGRREMLLEDLLGQGLAGLGRRMIITAIKLPVSQLLAYGYRRWSKESMGRAYLSIMVGLKAGEQAGTYGVVIVSGGNRLWPRRFEENVAEADVFDADISSALIRRAIKERLGSSNLIPTEYQIQLMEVLMQEAFTTAAKEIKS